MPGNIMWLLNQLLSYKVKAFDKENIDNINVFFDLVLKISIVSLFMFINCVLTLRYFWEYRM